MTKKFLILQLLLLIGTCIAAHAGNRYSSRMTQDGTIFFIDPHKLNKSSGIKNFEYDITLLTWSDSVTVNFTFVSPDMTRPEDLKIIAGTHIIKCTSYKPLYIDIKKDKYEIRITSKFPLSSFETIINSPVPPIFSFIQDGTIRTATYSNSAWNKERKKLNEIIQVFLYSK